MDSNPHRDKVSIRELLNVLISPVWSIKAKMYPEVAQETVDAKVNNLIKLLEALHREVNEQKMFALRNCFTVVADRFEEVLQDINVAIDRLVALRNNNHYA